MLAFSSAVFSPEDRAARALSLSSSSSRASPTATDSVNDTTGLSSARTPTPVEFPDEESHQAPGDDSPTPPDQASWQAPQVASPSPPATSTSQRLLSPSPAPPRLLSPSPVPQQEPASASSRELSVPSQKVSDHPATADVACSSSPLGQRPRPKPRKRVADTQSSSPSSTTPAAAATNQATSHDTLSPYGLLKAANCPPALLTAYEPVVNADFNVAWTACVASFARQQIAASFQDPQRNMLPVAGRPAEIALWYKQHRPVKGPEIQSHTEFLEALGTWWRKLQPDIRGVDRTGRPAASEPTSWASVVKPGKNGIFTMLCGLLWVGDAIFNHGEESLLGDWEALVEDVTWVLGHDVCYTSSVPANANESPSDTSPPNPSRSGKRTRRETNTSTRKRTRV